VINNKKYNYTPFETPCIIFLKAWSPSWNRDVRDLCSLPNTSLGRTVTKVASVISRSQQTQEELQRSGHSARRGEH
jgi:hypothetical protein